MHNGRSAVRRIDDVDLAVTSLNGIGIGEGIVTARNVPSIGIGVSLSL